MNPTLDERTSTWIISLTPCIVREDNTFDLKSNPDIQALQDYLEQLEEGVYVW